jgi:two-component sensor histidine kinase
MLLYEIPILLAGSANFILAFWLFFKAKHNQAAKVFAFYSIFLGIWNIGAFFMYFSENYQMALGWHKGLLFGMLFIFSSFYHFVLEITEDKNPQHRRFAKLGYLLSFLILIPAFFHYHWVDLVQYYWGYYVVVRPTDFVGMAYVAIFQPYIIAGLVLLKRKANNVLGIKRAQLNTIFWAMLITFLSGTTNFLPVFGIPIYPVGHLFNTLSSIWIAYAILSYQVFDIFVVLRKSLIFSILIGFIFIVYAGFSFALNLSLLNHFHGFTTSILVAFITVLGIRTLQPIIERLTDKIFFRDKVNLLRALELFGQEITQTIDLDKIQAIFTRHIEQSLKVSSVGILSRPDSQSFRDHIGSIFRNQAFVFFDEVTKYIDAGHMDELNEYKRLFYSMKNQKIEAFAKIHIDQDLEHYVILYSKLSDDPFALSEKEFIKSIIPALTASLKNVHYYQQTLEKNKLVEASKHAAAIGVLARGLAHEIKNPLMSLKSFFQLYPAMKETDRDDFSKIATHEITRIEVLLEKLRNFQLAPDFKIQIFNIGEIILDLTQLIKNDLDKRNVRLNVEIADKQIMILGDRDQLKQVILNILLNANEATADAGRIQLSLKKLNQHAILSITDSGCGIAPEHLENIFDAFFTTKKTGTGLGLSIVKNIVSLHQGKIDVSSVLGNGTTFTITLPAT